MFNRLYYYYNHLDVKIIIIIDDIIIIIIDDIIFIIIYVESLFSEHRFGFQEDQALFYLWN